MLLEVARLWSQTPAVPPRMILFAGVTAEEQGLLGSEYLGKHSPVPPGRISLDLNYDALARLGDAEEVEVSGAERTTFYSGVEGEAKTSGLAIRPDPHPEAGYYYRSDHFSLARVGIPSFSISDATPIVSKWRKRFCLARLTGLEDEPQGGRQARSSPQSRRAGKGSRL